MSSGESWQWRSRFIRHVKINNEQKKGTMGVTRGTLLLGREGFWGCGDDEVMM